MTNSGKYTQRVNSLPELVVFSIYCFFIVLFCSSHEPWFDELHALEIAGKTIPKIFYEMRFEGHFALWFLLLSPLTALPVWSLQIVSGTLSAVAGALWFFGSPFRFAVRVLVLLSYPLLYLFPTVSRCYALIPPLLWSLALLYPHRRERVWRWGYAAVLILLVHTHAYMEGLAGILFLYWAVDLCRYWKRFPKTEQFRRLQVLPAVLLGVAAAFIQVAPAFFCGKNVLDGGIPLFREGIASRFLGMVRDTGHYIFPVSMTPPPLWAGSLVLLLFLTAAILLFIRSRRSGLIFAAGWLWQLVFAVVLYPATQHRLYLPLLELLFVLWIDAGPVWRSRKVPAGVLSIVMVLALLPIPKLYCYGWKDLIGPFVNVQSTADFLHKNVDPSEKIVFFSESIFQASLHCLAPEYSFINYRTGKPFEYFRPNGKSDVTWALGDRELQRYFGDDDSYLAIIPLGMVQCFFPEPDQLNAKLKRCTVEPVFVSLPLSCFKSGEDYAIFRVSRIAP